MTGRRRGDRDYFKPNRPDGRTWIAPDVDAIFARVWPREPVEPEQVNGRKRITFCEGEAA